MGNGIKKKILFADDEEAARFLYSQTFASPDFQVLLAKDGREALEVFERESPDLVVLDISMPGLDGLEALRRLKAIRRDLPVILCTSVEEARGNASSACDAFVLKSVDMSLLKDCVDRLVNGG